MQKKISIILAIAMLVAATAFAAPGDQTENQNGFEQMYQYCNKVMQQWGNGNQQSQSGQSQAQPQAQQMSYNGMMGGMMGNGGMMSNGSYGNMTGNGNWGNMMGNGGMMGSGSYGNMMGSVEFQ